jgi:alpha/beta superfamily hydrolase
MREEKVFIPSDTIQLEGLLNIQEAVPAKGGVVLCHPHPQYGGDMHNTVLQTAVETASREGFSTLRFNFRGVGESGGSYSDGIGERGDVKAAMDYLYSKQKDSHMPFVLLGYSFGAWVGLQVAFQDDRVKGMVAIAPPLEMVDFGFLKGSKKQKLIIAGSRDFFCPARQLEKWYQGLEEPKSLALIQGVDHFFFSHTHLLIEPLRGFFKVLSQPQP